MIFVCGGAHSGTTLMATILGAHSKTDLIPYETSVYLHDPHNAKTLIENIVGDQEWAIEKTPRNLFFMPKIREDFPSSKFVVMFRNPLDVSASIYARMNRWPYAVREATNDLQGCINCMRDTDVIIVSYESLITDFDNTVKKVCKHVGLDYEKGMSEFHNAAPQWFGKTDNKWLNHRANQVKQPLYDGRGRWKKELSELQSKEISNKAMKNYRQLLRRTNDAR